MYTPRPSFADDGAKRSWGYRASGGNYQCCSCCTKGVCAGGLLVGAVVLFICAFVLPGFLDSYVNKSFQEQFVVTSIRSNGYPDFQDSKLDVANKVIFEVTMFNLTNPEGLLAGDKPCLQELGPFSYWLVQTNFDISWRDGGNLVDFIQWRHFIFEADKSVDLGLVNETDGTPIDSDMVKVTTINLVFQLFNGIMKNAGLATQGLTGSGLGQRLVLLDFLFAVDPSDPNAMLDLLVDREHSANEILFGFTADLGSLSFEFPGVLGNATQEKTLHPYDPSTYDGAQYMTMYTGFSANEQLGHCVQYVVRLNNATTYVTKPLPIVGEQLALLELLTGEGSINAGPVPLWDSARANQLSGSSKFQYCNPLASNDPTAPAYNEFGFRTILTERVSDVTVDFKGIKVWKYKYLDTAWLNSTIYPPNAEYYMNGPSGIWDISKMEYNMSIFISKPYFMNASTFVQEGIDYDCAPDGTADTYFRRPVYELDEAFLGTEPITGVSVTMQQRFQIGIYIEPLAPPVPSVCLPPAVFNESTIQLGALGEAFGPSCSLYDPTLSWLCTGNNSTGADCSAAVADLPPGLAYFDVKAQCEALGGSCTIGATPWGNNDGEWSVPYCGNDTVYGGGCATTSLYAADAADGGNCNLCVEYNAPNGFAPDLAPVYFPIYKFDLTTDIQQKTINLYNLIYDVQNIKGYSPPLFYVLGGLCTLCSAVLFSFVTIGTFKWDKQERILATGELVKIDATNPTYIMAG